MGVFILLHDGCHCCCFGTLLQNGETVAFVLTHGLQNTPGQSKIDLVVRTLQQNCRVTRLGQEWRSRIVNIIIIIVLSRIVRTTSSGVGFLLVDD